MRKKWSFDTKKPQYLPQNHQHIDYGAKQQISQHTDTSPTLDDKGTKRVQGIFFALLYVGRSVSNKIIVASSAIISQQAATTEDTANAIKQLLDYVATYTDDGILFRKSDMILAAHVDAGFINKSKIRNREGAHIFLS